MTMVDGGSAIEEALRRRIGKLERINAALMAHVERVTNQPEGAYSLFQTAIMLDGRVRSRTEELTHLTDCLERSNEALVVAKDEADRANRSKTRFLAAASHDLLQPLNATRLSVATLGDFLLDGAAATTLRRIERGLETIEEVIKTLLDISKLDAGVVVPQIGPVALGDLVHALAADHEGAAEAKGIRLVVRCPADLVADSDVNLLTRIIGNMVSNAVRYTGSGGVLVAARSREGCCRVDVVDTGRGIPEADRDLVFEEFYRGRNADGGGNGLGLGLSIVRRLVATLGHSLTFSSRVGHGSWFKLEMPLSDRPRPAPGREASPHPLPLAGNAILVVENDEPTLEAMTRLLEGWGMVVIGTSRASDCANRQAEFADVAAILADYHLDAPNTGVDIVARVRSAARRHIPALIATADHTADVRACVEAADCAFMHKPIRPAELRSVLASLVN